MYLCWCLFASKSVTRLLRQFLFFALTWREVHTSFIALPCFILLFSYFSAVPFTVRLNCLLRELIWVWSHLLFTEALLLRSIYRVTKSKLSTMSVPLGWKVHLSLKIFKLFLASQLVLVSGDVMLNPGPLSNESFTPSERLGFGNESLSSLDSESDGHDSFASQ